MGEKKGMWNGEDQKAVFHFRLCLAVYRVFVTYLLSG